MTAIAPTLSPAPATASAPRAGAPERLPEPHRPPRAPILSNPAVRLDPKTSIVVLEFYDQAGEVRVKIPSERQLRAYQQGRDPALPGAPARVESLT
ncbi:MAG: hypothetical protein IT556_13790 [Acetobacteraceae bacterium]|nr:hypothetical protein [Acetobacteraceae bacterium]